MSVKQRELRTAEIPAEADSPKASTSVNPSQAKSEIPTPLPRKPSTPAVEVRLPKAIKTEEAPHPVKLEEPILNQATSQQRTEPTFPYPLLAQPSTKPPPAIGPSVIKYGEGGNTPSLVNLMETPIAPAHQMQEEKPTAVQKEEIARIDDANERDQELRSIPVESTHVVKEEQVPAQEESINGVFPAQEELGEITGVVRDVQMEQA